MTVQLNSDVRPVEYYRAKASSRVAAYYDSKTASIIRKYGPGPRIHFHIGWFEDRPSTVAVTASEIQGRLVSSQEMLISLAAERWNAKFEFQGRVADFGCGLGGGSLFWAQECGADVTSITIAAEHIPLIGAYAARAGVADRVAPVLCAAEDFETPHQYDAAVAMESSCYFDRVRWFAKLENVIRPNGVVCIEDTFLGHPDWRQPFDHYWKTRIGPVSEYVEIARVFGFELEDDFDVTDRTVEFWRQSIAWSRLAVECAHEGERDRLNKSIDWHFRFLEAWMERGIEVRLIKFRKK